MLNISCFTRDVYLMAAGVYTEVRFWNFCPSVIVLDPRLCWRQQFGCIVLIGHSSIWFMNSQQNFFCFCHGALPLPFSCVFSWIVAVIQLTAYLYSLYRSVSFRAVKLRRVWKEARTTILMFEENVTCNCTSLQIAVELVGGFKT